jgi:hypothetical protein
VLCQCPILIFSSSGSASHLKRASRISATSFALSGRVDRLPRLRVMPAILAGSGPAFRAFPAIADQLEFGARQSRPRTSRTKPSHRKPMPTIRPVAPIIIADPAPLPPCGELKYPTSRQKGPPKRSKIPTTIRCLARCLAPRLDRRRSSLMIWTAFSVAMPLSWSIRRSSSSLTKPSMPPRTRTRRKSSHSVALGRNVRHLGQTPISGLKLMWQFGHSTSMRVTSSAGGVQSRRTAQRSSGAGKRNSGHIRSAGSEWHGIPQSFARQVV